MTIEQRFLPSGIHRLPTENLLSPDTIERLNHLIVAEAEGEVVGFLGGSVATYKLPEEIEKDDKDFVRTGLDLVNSPQWKLKRQPFLLETSRPGVFAAGDVRSGSVKRVASAVGEGAMSVQFVHEFLKTM